MVELKTPAEIDAMRTTGKFIAGLLDDLSGRADVGVNLLDLEQRARELIALRGAVSCYVDYAPSFGSGPFGNVICLSVNDAALHGLPHDYVLRDGDLLTMDIAVSIDGWVADSARSIIVGTPATADQRLIRATETALAEGIAAARPGGHLGDISHAIGAVAKQFGYRVNGDFGGHGLGRTMHEDPHVANLGKRGRGMTLSPGLTLALEPWFCATTDRIRYDADGWTLRSADGSRAAHSEHTIAITESGPIVLTA
ncbi:type I methionyl aminopeptidase [Gordonia sp. CPCC 205333]|uniref:type I methionyl aminopeptidase n=1 Tax=Gordonia sp. CPCC 205333 TaxID=3140790 RepID=UPI003AF38440